MSKFHSSRQLATMIHAVIALLFFSFSTVCHAELSKEDALLITAINTRLESTPNTGVAIAIKDGNISLQGVAASNVMISDIITNIAAVPGIKNINANNVTLPDGKKISQEAIIIGLTRGYLLRNNLFGSKVTTINEMPIKMSGEEGKIYIDGVIEDRIIYIDGVVNNLYIVSTTVTTAMQVTSRINRNIRIISRLTIRKVTVRMP